MKILIVGSDLNSLLLAKYIKMCNECHDIYMTSDDNSLPEIFTAIKIKENDLASIVDFVKYNAIEFTIAFSKIAIINGIADEFKKEGFPIFAPTCDASRITYFKSIAKKIMYKLKINTPKFGIFDRENMAIDYIRNAKYPVVIQNDFTLTSVDSNVYNTFSKAKTGIQKLFEDGNEKIVIENYIDEHTIYLYFVTDGYDALPLLSVEKVESENYTSTVYPASKMTEELTVKLLQRVIYPLIDDISKFAGSYNGIIGLKVKVLKDSYCVLDFYNGFLDNDFQALLSILEDNLFDIMYAASNGALCDSFHYINCSDKSSYTLSVPKKYVDKSKYTEDDFIECEDDDVYAYTNVASTLNYAKENLIDYLSTFVNEDLIKEIKQCELVEELVH